MATSFSELILSAVSKLIFDAVKKRAALGLEELFAERKLKRRVEDAVDRVVEPLLPFMKNEGLGEVQQQLLVEICVEKMRITVEEPGRLFRASLNGQKLFDELHAGQDYPEAIRHERLESIYELVGPQIGDLLCKLTNAVDEWKHEKWREDYSRFDEISKNQRDMIAMMVAAKKAPLQQADALLYRMHRTQFQRIKMDLDLTGLRGDQPVACKLEHMFVHPPLTAPAIEPTREVDELNTEEESAAYFLTSPRRSILIGPPGAGKSTLTKWLQMWAPSTLWGGFPIRIELRAFAMEKPPSISEILRKEAGTHLADELTPDRIRSWLDTGRIAFLIDGFDELPPAQRDVVFQWLTELVEAAPVCPIVLTSRPLTTDHLERFTGAWRKWSVGDFDEPRIVRYIEAWYRYMPLLPDAERVVDAAALAAIWQADPTLQPLTGNPLLLSTLLVVHHLDGELPLGRAKLYDRYIEGMLGSWDARRKIESTTVSLSSTQKRRLLRRLALNMHLDGRDQIDEDSAKAVIGVALRETQLSLDVATVLDTLRERSGLLIGPGIYGFAHKSIGEFLVAEAIVEGNERDHAGARVDRMMLFRHRHEDRWNTVLFFWAGLAPAKEVEEFVRDCMIIDEWREVLLAVSLVYDQGERLTTNLPAQIVQRIVKLSRIQDINVVESRHSFFSQRTGDTSLSLSLPYIGVRGMTGGILDTILRSWHASRRFHWCDVSEANEYARYMFWLCCACYPSSLDEWRQCLRDAPLPRKLAPMSASVKTEARWLVPFLAVVRNLAYSEFEIASPAQIVAAFEQDVPSLSRVTTFVFVLGLVVEASESRKHATTKYAKGVYRAFQRHIDLWGEHVSIHLDERWLLETMNTQWDGWFEDDKQSCDLLQECINDIRTGVETGVLTRTPAVDHVIQTIEQLMAKRALLLANPQATASQN